MKRKMFINIISILIISLFAVLLVGCTSQQNLRQRLESAGYTEIITSGDSVSEDGTWIIKRSNKKITDYNTVEIIKCKSLRGAKEIAAYKKYTLGGNSKYDVVRKGKIVYIGKKEIINTLIK